jgi:hypothetical protein
MKLTCLSEKIGARVVQHGRAEDVEIKRFYAGDKMSDLLEQATEETLLVTTLSNMQLLRVAGLMDVPGICLLNDVVPGPELLKSSIEHGTAILVSKFGMSETCEYLNRFLPGKGKLES